MENYKLSSKLQSGEMWNSSPKVVWQIPTKLEDKFIQVSKLHSGEMWKHLKISIWRNGKVLHLSLNGEIAQRHLLYVKIEIRNRDSLQALLSFIGVLLQRWNNNLQHLRHLAHSVRPVFKFSIWRKGKLLQSRMEIPPKLYENFIQISKLHLEKWENPYKCQSALVSVLV